MTSSTSRATWATSASNFLTIHRCLPVALATADQGAPEWLAAYWVMSLPECLGAENTGESPPIPTARTGDPCAHWRSRGIGSSKAIAACTSQPQSNPTSHPDQQVRASETRTYQGDAKKRRAMDRPGGSAVWVRGNGHPTGQRLRRSGFVCGTSWLMPSGSPPDRKEWPSRKHGS